MIRVLLVDDHELVRSGIAALLSVVDDIEVIGECDCGEQALLIVAEQRPDVVLMDINMPGMGGEEASRLILQNFSGVKIIGLSVHAGGSVPEQLLKMGVGGFVSKSSHVNEMVEAIRAVISGKRYLSQDVANNLVFGSLGHEKTSPFLDLSQRETEVTHLILHGKSIQEISEILQLSDKTVNTYRYRLYRKLNVKNDVELTRLAVRMKYLES